MRERAGNPMIANTDGGVSPQSWNRTTTRRHIAVDSFVPGLPGIGPRADAGLAPGAAGRGRLLGRGARRGYDPRIRIYLADDVSGSRIGRCLHPVCAIYPGPPAPGRRMGDLSRRPDRRQRLGEGVLRTEADGPIAGRAGHGPGARGHPRGRRGARVQQLHAVLPGAAGPDRLRRMPVRAAGVGRDPVAVEVQPQRDVGLDADDRRAAVDHVVLQAGSGAGPGARHRRAVPRGGGRPVAADRPTRSPGRTSSSGWTRS